jgi:hypothetical protein
MIVKAVGHINPEINYYYYYYYSVYYFCASKGICVHNGEDSGHNIFCLSNIIHVYSGRGWMDAVTS